MCTPVPLSGTCRLGRLPRSRTLKHTTCCVFPKESATRTNPYRQLWPFSVFTPTAKRYFRFGTFSERGVAGRAFTKPNLARQGKKPLLALAGSVYVHLVHLSVYAFIQHCDEAPNSWCHRLPVQVLVQAGSTTNSLGKNATIRDVARSS